MKDELFNTFLDLHTPGMIDIQTLFGVFNVDYETFQEKVQER